MCFNAKAIAEDLFADYPALSVQSWDEAQASLFNALRMEKVLTTVMLLMIVMVGAVNIVSTLVMVVADKGSERSNPADHGCQQKHYYEDFRRAGFGGGILGNIDWCDSRHALGCKYHGY